MTEFVDPYKRAQELEDKLEQAEAKRLRATEEQQGQIVALQADVKRLWARIHEMDGLLFSISR